MRLDHYGGHVAHDRTGRPLGRNQFTDVAQTVQELLAQLPALHAELEARMRSQNDSLRKSSLGGGPRPSTDQDGQPLPDYSDPTGHAATATPSDDTDGRALIDAWRSLHELERAAQSLAGRMRRQLHPPKTHTDGPTADRGCRSCARTRAESPDGKLRARYVPTHEAGLCQFCYSYLTAQGFLPGTETLRNWHRSGKCTDRDIERDLRAEERRRSADQVAAGAINPPDQSRPGGLS